MAGIYFFSRAFSALAYLHFFFPGGFLNCIMSILKKASFLPITSKKRRKEEDGGVGREGWAPVTVPSTKCSLPQGEAKGLHLDLSYTWTCAILPGFES